MMNKVLLAVASTLEAVTGIGLIIAPSMLRFLLGADVSSASLAIARIAGFGLLSLGIACWPRVERSVPRLRAMLIYNLLVTIYLAYLRFGNESVGTLLLPAFAVHVVLAILFIGVWFEHLTHESLAKI
jgi:uncharacterized protein YjeT (DUF2065 family)